MRDSILVIDGQSEITVVFDVSYDENGSVDAEIIDLLDPNNQSYGEDMFQNITFDSIYRSISSHIRTY